MVLQNLNNMVCHSLLVKAQPIALDEGNFTIDEFKFNVLHTPGHSPGSLTYVLTILQ